MVLPLLGLLAMGGAAYAHPYAKNRNQRMQGEYVSNAAAEQGLDLETATPDMMRAFNMGIGTLSGADAQRDVRTGYEGIEQRRQSDINSRRSAGVSRQNAMDRLAFDREMMQMQAQQAFDAGGVALANDYVAEAEPIMRDLQDYTKVANLAPDAARFDAAWLAAPENRDARREAEQTLVELKQRWIDREISFGREPSDAVQSRADAFFPTSLGMFRSRTQLDEFINSQMAETHNYLRIAGDRYNAQMSGDPTKVLRGYDWDESRTYTGEVIPDG